MELDFRYNQHLMGFSETAEKEGFEKPTEIKPYQELVDYFEANIANFCYQDFVKNVVTPQGNTQFSLSNGTRITVGNKGEIINIAIVFPNKTRFLGMWTKVTDVRDLMKK